MSGERHERLIALAARAGARMQELKNIITDLYVDTSQVITREEYDREMELYGHHYDEDCTSPFCTKVRQMYEAALQQVAPQGGA